MDLHCNEAACIKRAYMDPVLVVDDRVLHNMLQTETFYIIQNDYFSLVQKDLQPHMRKIVSEWMLEVCDEQRCEEDVFPLAINYLDRFLSVVPIGKMQLQLLGAVCMLVSSKLKDTNPLISERLVMYTDNSISLSELISWEHLLLMRLKWDLSAITPLDFLEQILHRLPELHHCSQSQIQLVKRHAKTFITLCATDYRFASMPPSIVAAGSVLAAINGLGGDLPHLGNLVDKIQVVLNVEKDFIINCKDLIEQTLKQHLLQSASGKQDLPQTASTEHNLGTTTGQPTTPTDVRDIVY